MLPALLDSELAKTVEEAPAAPFHRCRPYSAGGASLKKPHQPRRPSSSSHRRVPSALSSDTERIYADNNRILRQLRRFGVDEEPPPPSDEIELAKTTASVVTKIRCFYSDLRAERAVMERVGEGLKDQMRESLYEKERATAAAAAAEAARRGAVEELVQTKSEAKSAIENANATMAAAAQASASACRDASRLRVELEAMRYELRNARASEEESRRSKLRQVEELQGRLDQEASRSRELAEYGARMQYKVNGAEQEAKNTELRALIAEERAARLEDVAAHNAALAAEIQRLHNRKKKKKAPRKKKKKKQTTTKRKLSPRRRV